MRLFEHMNIENNVLTIGGIKTTDLAEKYNTPLYILNGDAIRKQCRMLKREFNHPKLKTTILYASKAFCSKAMYQLIAEEDLSIDVVSGGELYTAIQSGFDPKKIYFHGNNKSMDEIQMAVDYKIQRIIVDNLMELEYLNSLDAPMEILLRVNPGIEAHTHEYIQTAKETSKFGISFESYDLGKAIELIQNSDTMTLKGLHCHIGSQIHEISTFEKTAQVMLDQIKLLEHKYHLKLEELNLGGGFGVYYFEDQEIKNYDFLNVLLQYIYGYISKNNLFIHHIMIEPGRLIVANAGITLYAVGFSKETLSGRKYIFVNGGMTDNIRPALYQAKYEACVANNMTAENTSLYTIAGKCCESGDVLIDEVSLPTPKIGDILAVMSTGAYGYSMASHYNRIPNPAVVMVEQGNSKVIIQREAYEDLIRLDL
ncbi:MAG: diaminopimelate decarboxylase [Clostridia bacterium]|nr:diaminopimelate decarboxylase [Clostridia bacterium]